MLKLILIAITSSKPATFAPNAAPTSWLDRLAAAFVWAATGRTR